MGELLVGTFVLFDLWNTHFHFFRVRFLIFLQSSFSVCERLLNDNPFESPEEIAQRPFSDTAIRLHGIILIPKPATKIFRYNNYIFIVLPIAERSSFLNFLNLPFLLHYLSRKDSGTYFEPLRSWLQRRRNCQSSRTQAEKVD